MKQDISVEVDIPLDFTVIGAYLTLYHTPAFWTYSVVDYQTGIQTNYEVWGYSRNIKLYKTANDNQNYRFNMCYGSEYSVESNNLAITEIPNAFGCEAYTPSNTSGSSIEKQDSIDISSYINTAGKHKLILRTIDNIPSAKDYATACSKTGMVRASVNVIGYKSIR